MSNILQRTKKKRFNTEIVGFDIETYSHKNRFLIGCIWSDGVRKAYLSPSEFIDDIKKGVFNGKWIAATNLGFDFFGGIDELDAFRFIFRGSDLICAWTYQFDGRLYPRRESFFDTNPHKVMFIDTMNYSPMSVKRLGEIVGTPKLDRPSFLGHRYRNDKEFKELLRYCFRDALISKLAVEKLFKDFENLGGNPKTTIASTSMSIFRCKYLDGSYSIHDDEILYHIYKGYYGGRSEAFCRGRIADYNHYDFNSLYPSVMVNDFPDPNTVRFNRKNTDYFIRNYDGMSEVEMICPRMQYPILPMRNDGKLIFPIGHIKGYYPNVELRYALDNGYILTKVMKNIYYRRNCRPFDRFVKDLYKFRQENPKISYTAKLILNSLYGKFAQKFIDKVNHSPMNFTVDEIARFKSYDFMFNDTIIRYVIDDRPSNFCIPIWSAYVTAYGRIRLHKMIVESEAVYCDTDSVITKKEYKESKELGGLKLDQYVLTGTLIKPKFYMLDDIIKSKGIGKRITKDEFFSVLKTKRISYEKFARFKEAIRRGLLTNEIISVTKELDLEDNKRVWPDPFDPEDLQVSRPIYINKKGEREDENYREAIEGTERSVIRQGVKDLQEDASPDEELHIREIL